MKSVVLEYKNGQGKRLSQSKKDLYVFYLGTGIPELILIIMIDDIAAAGTRVKAIQTSRDHDKTS